MNRGCRILSRVSPNFFPISLTLIARLTGLCGCVLVGFLIDFGGQ